ncbi:amidase [Alteromonas sediminis]|uniref:Amidase n=1 Tax=Alteromonas sediminis TaxID=2259342 RepID=A0A3N5XZV2_9ALTE|nr:amidase family protein [Alteromonas sediminis]RPJ66712.1 amidase [Alteromonas sediminis]
MKKIKRISLLMAACLLTGSVVADQATQALARIKTLDNGPNGINSVLSVNPNAKDQARSGQGLLAGIPILIKDNIETKELPTTAGSLALIANDTKRDAPIIAKLRAQGAVILGKTNLSEWANFRSEDSISGWSTVGGLTRNPHNLSRSACGSSSGSGAAVAAGIVDMAIGTETNGSVICPASMNGIVGFKPTVGLLSAQYIVPISHSQDTAGPMTQTVAQAALLAGVMAKDEHKAISQHLLNFAASPESDLTGLKIGVVRNQMGNVAGVKQVFEAQLEKLANAGAELIDIESPSMPEDFWGKAYHVLLAEFKHGINHYLADSPADIPVRTLEALIALNAKTPQALQVFDQSIFEKAQETKGLESEEYLEALALVQSHTREKGIDAMLNEHSLDMLVAPSNNPSFLIDAVYGDNAPSGFAGIGWMAAIAGYPHLSVPAGKVKSMPVGISFITTKYEDASLFKAGQLIEKARTEDMRPMMLANDFSAPALQSAEKGAKAN